MEEEDFIIRKEVIMMEIGKMIKLMDKVYLINNI